MSIRELLLATAIVGILCAWWVSIQECNAKYTDLYNNGSPVAAKSNTGPLEGKSVWEVGR